ncbi:MAG: XylR family transcriptional regulator [Akkermansiaceae bacterium]|nr:XylR family transcriptional regulator [Akkermansiaceae bacterium]
MESSPKSPVRRVAILIETTRTYSREMLAGVSQYVHRHGPWSTFLELRSLESSVPPWLKNWDGDGILTRTHSREMANAIAATGLPAVELRSSNFNQQFPFVGMDNRMIGQLVADHFVNRGYQRFAAYTLDTESFFRERFQKFVNHLRESAGADCAMLPSQGESGPDDWESHQSQLIEWLESLEKPVGVFATNDQLATRLLDACQRAGISVPEEVAVVGCENETTLCKFASPPLTSVRFDGATVGYRAAELLDQLMKGDAAEKTGRILVPPKGIEIRGSSDEYVIDDAIVLQAVTLIRKQAFTGISVAEICDELGVSRSTLERRMKATLNRGAKAELLRVRFGEVNRLLQNTDFTIEAIAEMTGFSYAHYLQTSYRERYGLSPGRHRKNLSRTD